MSKNDVLGSIVRELVGVNDQRDLATILRTIQKGKEAGFATLQVFNKTFVSVAAATTFVSSAYFQTSDKLYVWPEFSSCITDAYSETFVKRGLAGVEKAFDLSSNTYDNDIIKQLGGEDIVRKHAFTPDQIADMIDAQPNGTDGQMLNNGYTNIFYMVGVGGELFAVRVRWFSGDLLWSVDAYGLDDGDRWLVGFRVFRNTVSSES